MYMRNFSSLCLIAAVFGVLYSNAPAATISVPPVVINSLAHEHFYDSFFGATFTSDKVQFPCTGGLCNGPGFTAAIGTGDTVVIRLQALAGKRFRVTRSSLGNQYFTMWAHWQTMISDSMSSSAQPTVTFENLTGVAPAITYNLTGVSDNGQTILTERDYTVTADFTFTAIQIQFTVTHALASMMRNYGPVNS